MLKYEYISKEMIVSPTARWVYRTAAVVSLTIFFSLAIIVRNGPTPLLKQILFIGVVAAGLITVGMEFFLFRFDDSPAWKQVIWFCLMIFIPLGPAAYCFAVYSRSNAVRTACEKPSDVVLSGPKIEI